MNLLTSIAWGLALLVLGLACQPRRPIGIQTRIPDSTMLHPDRFRDKFEEGIDFIASGTEPFWGLEIDLDQFMRFATLGGDSIKTPPAAGEPMAAANAIRYQAQTAACTLRVVVFNQPCTNGISGEELPKKVEVTLNDKRYSGCGRYLYDYRLHDIWVLERINGQPVTPADYARGLPQLEFLPAQQKVIGHTGCNSLNGSMEVQGKRIYFGRLATTRMACPDNGFEGRYVQSLENKLHRYAIEEGRLHLYVSTDTRYQYRKVD